MTHQDGKLDKMRAIGFVPSHEKWGPYVAERGWGSVREDYSADGDAWGYFTHEMARSRTYRRAEDGIAGFSDRFQVLLLAHAFWNGKDPILKERLFGLNSHEGNHGEDVKELYYYLDANPDHSYLKYLYKYPQKAFPYEQLVSENRKRSVNEREYEILDTGIFDDNAYFDIFIEYAKVDDEDLCVRIEAFNRGSQNAPLHILPHFWFRNQWSWDEKNIKEPCIKLGKEVNGAICVEADDSEIASPAFLLFDYHLGKRYLYTESSARALFTDNETNEEKIYNRPNSRPFVKDGIHNHLVEGLSTVNPQLKGTKVAFHHFFPSIEPGKSVTVRLRLSPHELADPLSNVDSIIDKRKQETNQFYATIHPENISEDEKNIQRQAWAGLIWSKQFYLYDVGGWIEGDKKYPPPKEHRAIRNFHWRHMVSLRVFSMPDKWEYPWFAAWDLTFQALAFSLIDLEFAKYQVWLLLFDQFQHPNGAIPAYEWEFSDVNPPVQAWAILKIFYIEKEKTGNEDFEFLEKCFHKLLLNFAWWINKIDHEGNNVFEGGFLGMDNIGFVDRFPDKSSGYAVDQSDGAGWIALLCLNLMRMALILAKKNPIYEGLGIKFFHHFVYVSASMRKGYWRKYDMWDAEDGFFYSYLQKPDGSVEKIPARSLVGIIPFFACDVWDENELKEYSEFYPAFLWITDKRCNLTATCVHRVPNAGGEKIVLGLLNLNETTKFLEKIWDTNEFRSDFGLRSLSKFHEANPAVFQNITMKYEPGEAAEKLKGGNSNWRGPIWFPVNYLLIDTLKNLHRAYQNDFSLASGNSNRLNLVEIAHVFCKSLIRIFTVNSEGRRACFGDYEKLQNDPNFQNYLLFFEHFHGDCGRGLGACHQTGWTALIANLIEEINKMKKPD